MHAQYTVVQKEVPAYVQTVSYQPIVKTVAIKQVPIPVYQPVVYHKHIQVQSPYQVNASNYSL